MARTGLTWTLKLNDAMSGAAKKIAASLDKVQGELEALDKIRVDGPSKSMQAMEDRMRARTQRAQELATAREERRASAASKRISDRIVAAEQRQAKLLEAARSKKGANANAIAAREQKYAEQNAALRRRFEQQEESRANKFRERSNARAQKLEQRLDTQRRRDIARQEAAVTRTRTRLSKQRDEIIKRQETASQKARERSQKAKPRAVRPKAERDSAMSANMFGAIQTGAMLAADAIAALANAVVALGQRVIELQSFKQATQFAFKQILGSSAAADDAWGRAQKIAESTGISIQEIAGSMNALLATGMGISEVEELTKRFADMKALNPATNVSGIAKAMTQIRASGRLQGDELDQLNEAGVKIDEVYAQLEKRLGKNRQEIIKLKEAGKISAEDAIAAIKGAMEKAAGGREAGAVAAEAAEKTLGGAIGRLKVQFEKLLMMDSPAFEKVAKLVNKISDGLASGKAQPILDAIFESINKIADALLAIPADSMAQKIQAVAFAIGAVGSAIAFTITALDKIQAVAITVWTGISAAVHTTVDAINNVSASVGAVIDKVLNLGSTFEEGGRKMGTSLVQGIIAAIAGGGGAIASAVSAVVTEAVKAAVENIGDVDLSLGGSFGASPAGDAMMMGAMAGREVRSTTTNKQFAPTVNVNISGGASNTGGIVGAISDTLKSLNNSFA